MRKQSKKNLSVGLYSYVLGRDALIERAFYFRLSRVKF